MDFEKRYATEIQLLGKRLKEIRLEKGLTQVDLEVKTGINNGDISRIEQGKLNIEFFTVVKFAEALDASIASFFNDEKRLSPGKKKQPAKRKKK
jgi:HTH-type transcriptional regulator, competence development regulator